MGKRSTASKILDQQAGLNKPVSFCPRRARKKSNALLRIKSNNPATARGRRQSIKNVFGSLERDSGVSGFLFLHHPNWKMSSVHIKKFGPIGRKMKYSKGPSNEAFEFMKKYFYLEVAKFEEKRPPDAADENAIFEHVDDEEVVENQQESEKNEEDANQIKNALESIPDVAAIDVVALEQEYKAKSSDEDESEDEILVLNARDKRFAAASHSASLKSCDGLPSTSAAPETSYGEGGASEPPTPQQVISLEIDPSISASPSTEFPTPPPDDTFIMSSTEVAEYDEAMQQIISVLVLPASPFRSELQETDQPSGSSAPSKGEPKKKAPKRKVVPTGRKAGVKKANSSSKTADSSKPADVGNLILPQRTYVRKTAGQQTQ